MTGGPGGGGGGGGGVVLQEFVFFACISRSAGAGIHHLLFFIFTIINYF